MRVGIDYRVLSTDAADRGMGRYTQQQLVKTLESDTTNEYVIFCYPGCRSQLIDRRVLDASNTDLVNVELPLLSNGIHGVREEDILEYSADFQSLIFSQRLDVFHSTTPFIPPVISNFDVCAHVATLYDLIPLIYPDSYLHSSKDEYLRGLELLRRADRIIAISNSARSDANAFLGIRAERISVMYPWIEPVFQPLAAREIAPELRAIRERFPLPENFLLGVTGVHHSKNPGMLLRGYSRLSSATRRAFPLVIVLPSPSADAAFRDTYGVHEDVVYLRDVSDLELCALYNAATALVHPSRYEGFGYPVAEAMSCGAPVITTTASSLPEVAGAAARLVDPDDVDGLVDAIELVCSSEDVRASMSRLGVERARSFSLEREEFACPATYDDARHAAADPVTPRTRVAVWSSLPPLPCGVADYTADLLLSLADIADVEVFADGGYVPSLVITQRHKVHHHAAFERRQAQEPFDTSIFQMGGTSMQAFMHRPIRENGGIVVLHDLLMAHGLHHIYRAGGRADEFRETIVMEDGASAVSWYDRAVRGARSEEQLASRLQEVFDRYPLLGWLVANSDRQVVHMKAAGHELEAAYPDAWPLVVDMGVVDPWQGYGRGDVARIRWSQGIPAATFLIAVFGSLVPIKRVESCIRAVDALRAREVDCLLLLVGDAPIRSYENRLEELVEELALTDAVRKLGRVNRRTFDELLIACDAVVNLRYPSMKGMSAILVRALAAGKPVLISDIPEWRELPDACCIKIPPDENEVGLIADRLQKLATSHDVYAASSAAARAYFRERGTTRRMAEQYIGAVRASDHRRGKAGVAATAQ